MARFALVAALVFAVGCEGGDPCAGSKCANDARPSASEYQACVDRHNAVKNERCNQQNVAYELCILALLVSLSYASHWLAGWIIAVFLVVLAVFFTRERFLPSFWLAALIRLLFTCLFLGVHLIGLLGTNRVVSTSSNR